MTQTERIVAVRNWRDPSLSAFVNLLRGAISACVGDRDLAACAYGFFYNPRAMEHLQDSFAGDGIAIAVSGEGEAMLDAWRIVKSYELPELCCCLASSLPVRRNRKAMGIEELASMPGEVLKRLLLRASSDEDDTFAELAQEVSRKPEKFPREVVEYLDQLRQDTALAGRQSTCAEEAPPTERYLTELRSGVSMILEEVRELRQRILELEQASSRRRGIFG